VPALADVTSISWKSSSCMVLVAAVLSRYTRMEVGVQPLCVTTNSLEKRVQLVSTAGLVTRLMKEGVVLSLQANASLNVIVLAAVGASCGLKRPTKVTQYL
jgi:hypothetical protein